MFRFARSGSVLFQFLSWLFVASLFCDGANLDDLLGGRCVIHDDVEIAAASTGIFSGLSVSAPGLSQVQAGAIVAAPFVPSPAMKVPVVIDQDSPSALHDEFHHAWVLHIRFCSILI